MGKSAKGPNRENVRDKEHIRDALKKLEKRQSFYDANGYGRLSSILQNAIIHTVDYNNPDYLLTLKKMKTTPVTIDEFVEGDDYLGNILEVWPELRKDLRIIKPDIIKGARPIFQVWNSSCIGTGKSIIGQVCMLYDLYFLSCFDYPQEIFQSLSRHTPIVMVLQSTRPQITNRVLYTPLRQIFEEIPYMRKYVKWDRDKESVLILENNVHLVPMVADPQHFLGQAVIGGQLDEANFMEVVLESRKTIGPSGKGGLFDQAELVYKNIVNRRASRFMTKGPSPGVLYMSSSVNYKGDFMDRNIAKIKPDDKHVVVFNHRQWDVKPFDFSKKTFKFLVGTDDYPARVLKDGDKPGADYPRNGRVVQVPMDFKKVFEHDPDTAQRDFLGISSSAISRFISKTHKITESVAVGKQVGLRQFVRNPNIVLGPNDPFFEIIEEHIPNDKHKPRYVHIDLSRTGDRCGIAMSKILGYAAQNVNGVIEQLPVYGVDMILSIEPSPVYPIDIPEIRNWLMLLATHYGFNIQCVSYDGFDSRESIQIWRKAGISSMVISMDKTSEPCELYKTALYSDRVLSVDNPLASTELAQLEKHEKGGKTVIDHPPTGSKDLADAVIGSIKNASIARINRVHSGVIDEKGNAVTQQNQRRSNQRRRTSRTKVT